MILGGAFEQEGSARGPGAGGGGYENVPKRAHTETNEDIAIA